MPQSNAVITGMGVVSAIGVGCENFFEEPAAEEVGCYLSPQPRGRPMRI